VRPETGKFQKVRLELAIDEDKIGAYMTVAEAEPFATQSMVTVLDGQRSVREEHIQDGLHLSLKGSC
jgi:hypothetical protein